MSAWLPLILTIIGSLVSSLSPTIANLFSGLHVHHPQLYMFLTGLFGVVMHHFNAPYKSNGS